MNAQLPTEAPRTYTAERPKAFVDAVVAIAMTLLILPLMESVSEAAGSGDDALTWIIEHQSQLVSFVVSFAIIAMFWMNHQRMFEDVRRVTTVLLWLLVPWMLTIVWLPVATALSGRMEDRDPVAKLVYIGSMILTSLLSLGIRLYLHRHPQLHEASRADLRLGIAADVSVAALFALALVLTLVFPVLGYYSLLVMFASGGVQALLNRW